MAKIKVLLVSSKLSPEYSGAGHRIIQTYLRLIKNYDIDIQALCGSEEFLRDINYSIDKIKVSRLNSWIIPYQSIINEDNNILKRIKLNLKVILELVRVYLKIHINQYDIVHVVGRNYITSVAIILAYFFKKPLIVEYVTYEDNFTFSHEPGILRMIVKDKPYKSKNTVLIAISPLIEEALINHGFTNIWMRPNAINADRFRFNTFDEKLALRQKITKFGPDDVVFSYIAKWRPSKNHIFLLKLMRLLPEKFKLIMGGPLVSDGPYLKRDLELVSQVKQMIQEYKMDSRVFILDNFIDNTAELMSISDAYLMPTQEEALGTPLLEAIAVGRPVIANNLSKVWGWLAKDFPSLFLTPLQEEHWLANINKALVVRENDLRLYSSRILEMASSKIINQKYFFLLKDLKNRINSDSIISAL
jgi:glycosyltransferase involved in cell wall biosynthesis